MASDLFDLDAVLLVDLLHYKNSFSFLLFNKQLGPLLILCFSFALMQNNNQQHQNNPT